MRKVTIFTVSLCLTAAVIAGICFWNRSVITEWITAKKADSEPSMQQGEKDSGAKAEEAGSAMHFCLRLPKGVSPEEITISNDYLTQTVRIELPSLEEEYFLSQPLSGPSDHVVDVTYVQGRTHDRIELQMEYVYELSLSYDEEAYYLDFLDPHTVYDKIVVIDAGHGGVDSGASKKNVLEKEINLGIALELKELLDASKENIKAYYTRIDDGNPTNTERVQLANKSQADLFLSIHINSYEGSGASSIAGTEVMYSTTHTGTLTSRRFAEICMEELTAGLESWDRGVVEGDSIFIINQSESPVALAEVGFITNSTERKLLNSAAYQKKAAEALYQAILRALGET